MYQINQSINHEPAISPNIHDKLDCLWFLQNFWDLTKSHITLPSNVSLELKDWFTEKYARNHTLILSIRWYLQIPTKDESTKEFNAKPNTFTLPVFRPTDTKKSIDLKRRNVCWHPGYYQTIFVEFREWDYNYLRWTAHVS